MRQNDGHVHDDLQLQLLVKQRDTVEDVDRQPANGKQSHDDGEGFGSSDFLLQQPVILAVAVAHALQLDLPQLLPGHVEYLQVDAEHDEQWQQHADKEIKVHHVMHVYHALKQARELAAPWQVPRGTRRCCDASVHSAACVRAVVTTFLRLQVPSKEWDEANNKGENP